MNAFTARLARLLSALRLRKIKARRRAKVLAGLEGLEERQLLTSTPVGYLIQGQVGSYQVPLNGAASFTAASVTSGTLPYGLSLSSAGVISGTPAIGTQGLTSSLTVHLTPATGAAYDQNITLSVLANQFVDPNYSADDGFGTTILVLSSGNVVVTAPSDDSGGTDAGAVYLFNGSTGALISTLKGSTASDQIGSGGLTDLGNGNFVVQSPYWNNGTASSAGAATWGNGTTGVSGAVSSSNSLVGSSPDDQVGGSVTSLGNGNYVVATNSWDNGTVVDAGAVTWGSGTAGVKGVISSSNSLVGSKVSDQVGSNGVATLSNGNYVVQSPNWDNGTVGDAGAVTWGSGTAGVKGVISSTNSLVGSKPSDQVGSGDVTTLSNGGYVVVSTNWDSGTIADAGAVTWGNGTAVLSGTISSTNSLIGSTANDQVGSGSVTKLSSGNYVVQSTLWDNGTVTDAGAVTWGSSTAGVKGTISSSNSLVGSHASDQAGSGGIKKLTNGNYVVSSPDWDNSTATDAGAVTWGNGTAVLSGTISSTNSLIGSTASDQVGFWGITVLGNGNYVVASKNWDNGTVTDAGAATWGSGTAGVKGTISSTNSLVGSKASDQVGSGGVTALSTNGNYVVQSPNWDNGTVTDAGAATWGSGTAVLSGTISSTNSLVGSRASDQVGGDIAVLTNGNYVVLSPSWDNGTVTDAGAATWGNGTVGIKGTISSTNSLVGTTASDSVGTYIPTLNNGNYVVLSPNWDNGTVVDAGAVTWASGTAGVTGVVSSANSLVGSTSGDAVGSGDITALTNGNYVVTATLWDNGTVVDAGAVTWGNGTVGVKGVISSNNSLVGSSNYDQIGSDAVTALSNGNYLVLSGAWTNGTNANAGTATWGSGTAGISGVVTGLNSLVGPFYHDRNLAATINTVTNQFLLAMLSPGIIATRSILPPTTTTLTSSANPSNYNSVVTLTATVTSGATGTVQFYADGTALGSAVTISGTTATYSTSTLATGSHSITAVYGGNSNYASSTSIAVSQTVNQASTTTTLVSSSNPSTYGGSVTFTATVTSGATGTVTFMDGSTTLGTGTISGTTATYTTTALTAGSHSITAVYGGNSGYVGSTSNAVSQTVNQKNSTTTLVSSSNPSTYGGSVTFTATVTSGVTGTVTFKDGSTTLGTGTISGTSATYTTTTLTGGNHSITAVYGGDANFNGSTSIAVTQTVNKAASTTSVASSANPSTYGGSVTYTATVTSGATGTVTFKDGSTTLGTGTISGTTATYTTSTLTAGSHSITAVYGGDSNFNTSPSSAVTQTVSKSASTSTVTSSANPSVNGSSVTFTATVTSGATGTVTFKDGATTLGTGTISSSTATYSTSSLSLGNHSITAVYGGDANFNTSTSSIVTQTVSYASTTTLVSSSNPSTYGGSVTFTATVTSGATGTVTFKDGSTTLGSGTISGTTATYSTSALTTGSHSITAVYGGNSSYVGSTSNAVSQTVSKASFTTTLVSSSNPSIYGNSVTFTATVASGATGTVTFKDGATTLGTGTISGTTATFSTTGLTTGSHSITAKYEGDSNYNFNTSSAVIQIVNKADTTTTLTSSANPSIIGSTVTFTATVTTGATGAVTFYDYGTVLDTRAITGSTATFSTSGLSLRTHSIQAVYQGDSNYYASPSSRLTQEVKKTESSVSLASSANPITYGNSVTFTATVTAGATGLVEFRDGGWRIGDASIVGTTATFTVPVMNAGNHTISAFYYGNAQFSESTSPTVIQTITKALPTLTLVSNDSAPVAPGNPVEFTATATGGAGTIDVYSGTFDVYDGASFLETNPFDSYWDYENNDIYYLNTCTFKLSFSTVGNHNITVVYSGDSNYASYTSNAITQPVVTFPQVGYLIQGTAGSFQVPTGGISLKAATVSAGSLPSGLSLSSTGLISGTPAAGTQDTNTNLSIELTPSDGSAPFTQDITLSILANQFVDPNPVTNGSDAFGSTILTLSNGNVVVAAPYANVGARASGAVYLFNGKTGALISTLTGSSYYDCIGSGGITDLGNGNYAVLSPSWDKGSVGDAGAITWCSSTLGLNGVVSSLNSLVGSTARDQVGSSQGAATNHSITILNNGNYVISSPVWSNGSVTQAGAVTWVSSSAAVVGVISSDNSLVGTTVGDMVGRSITALTNGNYVITSPYWNNDTVAQAGAVTWASGTSGIVGVITSDNSLVGSTDSDQLGWAGVTALSNGNYVIDSSSWDNGTISNAGAVTWGNGTRGVTGVISSVNSLVGTTADDWIGGDGVSALSNGNYVVRSTNWDNGTITNAGAVTWGNGTSGTTGAVSNTNSLVGSSAYDMVGSIANPTGANYAGVIGISLLSDGNYVISSPNWDKGTITDAGAVTWGSGTAGVTGTITSANSLVGSSTKDRIGSGGIAALTNGNYVVPNWMWDNGTITDAGAVTWGSGSSGVRGVVSSANSLIGSSASDQVGFNGGAYPFVTALANGNYVMVSLYWNNGTMSAAGAVTWGNGTSGTTGVISSVNSLVGTSSLDRLGSSVRALTNGNYVVSSNNWTNGTMANAGAVTWGNGESGLTGYVSSVNSLVGSSAHDWGTSFGITALSNGNYVVTTPDWSNGTIMNAGAVTWGNGTSGLTGVITSNNSLVGSIANDKVGLGHITVLSNGNYLVETQGWNNGGYGPAGAVTWGNGTSGVTGIVSGLNSLVGPFSSGRPTINTVTNTFMVAMKSPGLLATRSILTPSSTTVSSSASTTTYGNTVTFTATVPSGATGTVTFQDGSTTLGIGTISGNSATFSTTSLSAGSHSITAVYAGDNTYTSSTSSAVSQTVNQAGSTTTLVSSANPSNSGSWVTFTATVTSGATGAVTFKDGSTTLGTGTISGTTATFSTSSLITGSHSITAVYGGDTNFSGSTSSAVSQTVNTATPSATTLASSTNPSTYGSSVTFTATVTSGATGTVTFKDGSSTLGTGTISGTTATFSTSTLTAGTHSITAVYGGDSNYAGSTSSAVSQTVNQASSTTTVVTSANSITYGDTVTFTATVTTGATGTVTFKNFGTSFGSGTISGNTATFTTSSLTAGSYKITAVYAGDTNFLTSTSPFIGEVVNKANTTTSLVSSSTPSTYGGSVTFTAAVTSGATGTVTFKDGSTTLGTGTISGTTATFSTTSLTAGNHSITAVYGGDGNYNTSTSTAVSQTVNQATSTTSLASSANPSTYGATVTFTATVTSGATGTVTFKDGSTTLGTGTISGTTAMFSTSSLTAGSHSITAVYGGDTNFTGSTSSAVTQTVSQASSTTSLISSANPSIFGDSVTFTATVTSGATGTVTFKDGSTTLGTGTISGTTATFSTSALSSGSHAITAVYAGDSNFSGSTSSAVSQTVSQASSTTTLASSANTSSYGDTVTFTATVTSGATGTVTFKDGSTTLGAGTISGTTATFSTAALTGGSHSITAVYGGDSNFTGSTSSAASQTVSPASSTTALVSSANPSTYGDSVTFTATVTSGATGTVTFKDGSTTLGTGTISGTTATFSTATLTGGNHSITAVYGGDSNFATSTSVAVMQVVAAAPLVTSNPTGQSVNVGSTATFTATAIGSPTPTILWQVSTNGGTSWSNIAGATSTSYTTPTLTGTSDGYVYRAMFINSLGSAATTAATLRVNQAPAISSQPASVTTNANSTATFTAAATGSPTPTVQWQKNTGSGWTDILGATGSSYTTSVLSSGDTGSQFRAVFTNTFGTATTNPATLTIAVVANVSSTSVGWGTQSASLVDAGSGRLLPAGRTTDIPWLGINKITLTLDQAIPSLAAGDITLKSVAGFSYSISSVTGSGTTWTINLGGSGLANPDKVTVTVGGSSVASYSRRLDVLPGDANDDGLVSSLDQMLVSRQISAGYIVFYDIDGTGTLTSNDVTLVKNRIGTKLPV